MIALLVVSGTVLLSCVLVNLAVYRDFGAAGARGRSRPSPRDLLATPAFVAECLATLIALVNAMLPTRRSSGAVTRQARGTLWIVLPPWLPRGVLRVLRARLHAHGWSTTFAPRVRASTAGEAGERLARAIAGQTPRGTPVTILAFGAAGLAARACAAAHAGERPLRLLTLATPHQGTRSTFASPRRRAGSTDISNLAALDPPGRAFDAVAIYSDFDAWVFPAEDAYYPGAFNIEVRGIGHVTMLFSNRVAGLVLENLSAPPTAPAA
jgi:hypothetical protein